MVRCGAAVAEDSPQPGNPRPPADVVPRAVAATVDGEAVYLDQVERELAAALGNRAVDPQARSGLLAITLEQLIQRQLIMSWLASTDQAASDQDVEAAVQRTQHKLTQQGQSLAEYCQDRGLDERQLRRSIRWQLSWERLLSRYMTGENLQRYFEQHRRDFDGTRLRVAHILWKVPAMEDQERLALAVEEAQRVRQDITGGRLTFATAARKHSQAPSAEPGGDIGFISRHEPMPEPFSRVAFALQPGEVSEPVITAFGVHLISCLEVQTGNKTWSDVRPALEVAAAAHLFAWAANRGRPKAVIEYTGVVPNIWRNEAEARISP